jgi:tetratricopeptide (TPR) repeat protein
MARVAFRVHFQQRGGVATRAEMFREGNEMAEIEPASEKQTQSWTPRQVYLMSTICIVLGLVFGYFLRGSATPKTPAPVATVQETPAGMPPQAGQSTAQMPSLDDMKRMADKKAEPLLAQLKSDPKNLQLLVKIGATYKSAHQFKEAANYYGQALALNPKDVGLRDEVGAAQFYAGEVDPAIATFEAGLKYAPNDASLLFDLGVLKMQKKGDAKGAVELWQRLLKTNPNLPADKKQQIEKLIAQATAPKLPMVN